MSEIKRKMFYFDTVVAAHMDIEGLITDIVYPCKHRQHCKLLWRHKTFN